MIRKTLLTLAVAALVSSPALATGPKSPVGASGVIISKDKRLSIATAPLRSIVPYKSRIEPDLSPIIDNLAHAYPDGTYFSGEGYTVSGPTSAAGGLVSLAVAFTPATAVRAKQVVLGIGYVTGSKNGVVASINADDKGLPGSAIASFRLDNLPVFGTCCVVATQQNGKGAALDAGTQYWLVVRTNHSESDEWAAWNLNDTEQVNSVSGAQDFGSGWQAVTVLPAPAFAIYGK
jgi:hypothetical protein